MKLDPKFVTREIGDTQVMVAVGTSSFSGLVRSNKTAAFIVDQLKEDTTKEKILAAMTEVYDADPAVMEKDIDMVLEKLRSIGALDE